MRNYIFHSVKDPRYTGWSSRRNKRDDGSQRGYLPNARITNLNFEVSCAK